MYIIKIARLSIIFITKIPFSNQVLNEFAEFLYPVK